MSNAKITLSTGKLSLASWVVAYVSPRQPFRVTPLGTRKLAIDAQAKALAVRLVLPITKSEGEPKPGLFDSHAVKMLDGLDWNNEPCTVERTRTGMKVTAPAIGPRAIAIPEVKGAEIEWYADRLMDRAETDGAVVSLPLLTLRERLMEKGEQIPGTLLAAFAVLDRLTPETVEAVTYSEPAGLVLRGKAQGIMFGIVLPLTQVTEKLVEAP